LTEKVRRKPYSVVLFDEIEKAHPDVMNILLQILDEGKISDSKGRVINFENTVICMTSNAGSTDKTSGIGFAKTEGDVSKERAENALKQFLRPEFISRLDEIIVFNTLEKSAYVQIANLMLEEMREPLLEQKMYLKIEDGVAEFIAEKSFGGKFGGRDIRKYIRRNIEIKIADAVINANSHPKNINSNYPNPENHHSENYLKHLDSLHSLTIYLDNNEINVKV
jgi:ATP-dependent Clp protease ATP-binding subunit ClpA